MTGPIRLNQEGTMASVVNHVGLCVSDAAASRRFYENVFGFTHRSTLKVEDGPAATLLHVSPPVGLTATYLELAGFVLELLHFDRDGNDPVRPRSFRRRAVGCAVARGGAPGPPTWGSCSSGAPAGSRRRTSGEARTAPPGAAGDALPPAVLIISVRRPVQCTAPSPVTNPMSPVWRKPSASSDSSRALPT